MFVWYGTYHGTYHHRPLGIDTLGTGTVPVQYRYDVPPTTDARAQQAHAQQARVRTAVGQLSDSRLLALALAGARSHANNTHKELVKAYRAIMKVAVDLKKDGKNF
jgi:hypothetical protein